MTSVTSSKKLIAIRTIRTKYNSANSGALKKGFDLNVYKGRRETVLSFEAAARRSLVLKAFDILTTLTEIFDKLTLFKAL